MARLDRISNLPDSVLNCILSLLPMKDAVSTSILSARWRYLYASVFNLDVDFYLLWRSPKEKSIVNLLDKMLCSHTVGSIEQFRLNYVDYSRIDTSRVCEWISAALGRGAKDLDLVVAHRPYKTTVMLPSFLFCSKTLARLKLDSAYNVFMTLPIHVSLPSLKTLDLQRIKFEDYEGSLKRLISSCPILEDLSISNCYLRDITCLQISIPSLKRLTLVYPTFLYIDIEFCYATIAIDLPKLVYFRYDASKSSTNYSIGHMPSLLRADISITCCYYQRGLVQLFKGIGNVSSLHLGIHLNALQLLFSGKRYVAFGNLVKLSIYDPRKEWNGKRVFKFLEFSPNLQTLVIDYVSEEVGLPMEKVPWCILYQLKEFHILDFLDECCLVKIVTYILNNATVLENLTIRMSRYLIRIEEKFSISSKKEEKFRITERLMSLPRISNKCQVVAF